MLSTNDRSGCQKELTYNVAGMNTKNALTAVGRKEAKCSSLEVAKGAAREAAGRFIAITGTENINYQI